MRSTILRLTYISSLDVFCESCAVLSSFNFSIFIGVDVLRRWEDNIKTDLREVRWGAWTGYGQVAGCCECGNELSGSIKCGKLLE